jgi:uncharacterized protein YqjF (DUF2071 family)
MIRQSWQELLFAHWPIPAEHLRHLVPKELGIQEFNGTSWVGVVPFRMSGVMLRSLPAVPWLSSFTELNVRLYVERDGKPGVWFLSLDATNPIAVWFGRRFFHLPYFRARMNLQGDTSGYRFSSQRLNSMKPVICRANYRPTSDAFEARSNSLEHFLCLYACQKDTGHSADGSIEKRNSRMYRCEVHHAPWPIQSAEGVIEAGTLFESHGIDVGGAQPVLHFTRGVDVITWPFELLNDIPNR